MSADDDERAARAAWSLVTEPGDPAAGALVEALGAAAAWSWLGQVQSGWRDPVPLDGATPSSDVTRRRLGAAVARWSSRWEARAGERLLDRAARLGAVVLVPGDAGWPQGLGDLGVQAPACLWVRGEADLAAALGGAVALVGARACTAYGEHVTAELAADLASEGRTVLSGGAYGIDAAAHRAALAAGGRTVAVLAGGVDRLYPAGNARLLAALVQEGGAVVAEVPPGGVPSRSRFLQRNRLIAAATTATVVVEAAWRSGAMSTAGHAAALLRPVGAVPGPVTSAASAGCHRLLREGVAVCVTDAADVRELLAPLGHVPGPLSADPSGDPVGSRRVTDGLDATARRVLDALPVRRGAEPTALARTAGLGVAEVLAVLGVLEVEGLAERGATGWRCGRRVGAGGSSPDRSSG